MSSVSQSNRINPTAVLMPAVFVFLWSTGFIGAKLGLPYAEPMTFLAIRFAIASALLLLIALIFRAPWPRSWGAVGHIAVMGLLMHGAYLGAVFASISFGVEAGVSALIVSMQPLLVAVAAGPLLGERITRLQWLGLLLGVIGVVLVVWRKLELGIGTPEGMALSGIGLIALAAGTLYQKRFGGDMDLRSGNVIQYIAAGLFCAIFAFVFEERAVVWSGEFVFAMSWLVLVLSLGAITLLYLLIRRGAASSVSSLFFLTPPVTAVIAYFLFGETFGMLSLIGMAVAVVGVALVNLKR